MDTIKNLKITCLIEESAPRMPFWASHGLSMLIEADGKKILFDSGSYSDTLLHNISELKFSLSDIDYFFLSHTHDDHSGGIYGIRNSISSKEMICTSDAFSDKMPHNGELVEIMSNVKTNTEDREIAPGLVAIAEKDSINPKYPVKEIALVGNLEEKGLIIILGCSHYGIENIIDDVKAKYPDTPVHAIVGGLHLKDSSIEEIKEIISIFKRENIKIILANHCTGFKALKELSSELPEATQFIADTVSGSFHSGKDFVF